MGQGQHRLCLPYRRPLTVIEQRGKLAALLEMLVAGKLTAYEVKTATDLLRLDDGLRGAEGQAGKWPTRNVPVPPVREDV